MTDTKREIEHVLTGDDVPRVLGARDGLATALIAVRRHIGRIQHRRIDSRFVRQIKRREEILSPLRELEREILEHHGECQLAYDRALTAAKGGGQ